MDVPSGACSSFSPFAQQQSRRSPSPHEIPWSPDPREPEAEAADEHLIPEHAPAPPPARLPSTTLPLPDLQDGPAAAGQRLSRPATPSGTTTGPALEAVAGFQPSFGSGGGSKHWFAVPRCRALPDRATRLGLAAAAAAAEAPASEAPEVLSRAHYDAGVSVVVSKAGGKFQVEVHSDHPRPELVLHWAINDWKPPPEGVRPGGTVSAGDQAVQSRFEGGHTVRIAFPEAECPSKMVFVLKEGETWTNNGGSDFIAYLKPPGIEGKQSLAGSPLSWHGSAVSDVLGKVIEAESTASHWSLFNRFILALQLLDAADTAGPDGMAFVMTWLRLSTMRQLDWYRNSNYQSKDIAHVQKTLAQAMANKAATAKDPQCRLFARMCLAGLPRGGGDGDAIRHGILNVMRQNGIKEGHRPGIDEKFLEQWHQKLHTNTTPEDVLICEAYIAALHSGYMDDFWRFLWEWGGVSRERMASMNHPITATPLHLPHLIGPMQHYLWILKTTHSGADLDVCMEMAKGHMDGDLSWVIFDILANRNEWWVPGKIVEARHRLKQYWQREGAPRDVLLLDIALDNYFRLCVERTDKGAMSGDDLLELVALVLNNATVASESEELAQCYRLWERVKGEPRWSPQWALLAMAAADNTALCLEHYMDGIASLVQPHAERFAAACSNQVDPKYVANFGEEVVRGQPVFMLSVLLRFLDPMLRSTAGVGSWQVVSQAVAEGEVRVMDDLEGVQGQHFETPLVVVAERLTGNEDIPQASASAQGGQAGTGAVELTWTVFAGTVPFGIVAVLTSSATDVLSHIAIRARSQGVLLATCFDPAQLDAIRGLEGQHVEAGVTATGEVAAQVVERKEANSLYTGGGAAAAPAMRLAKPTSVRAGSNGANGAGTAPWVVGEGEFQEGVVGGKSRNLAQLKAKLPDWISAPSSVALPFGTFERALQDPINREVAAAVAAAAEELSAVPKGGGVPGALAHIRDLVRHKLKAPQGCLDAVLKAAEAAGLSRPDPDQLWAAICRVWASKWNDRAWLSRRAQGVPEGDLFMAVLLQQVVPADYAFVLHTADPVTGEHGEVHGELVVGMGEALVGNFPGRALSFTAGAGSDGNGGGGARVASLPSKREGLFVPGGLPTLIARSDSNGEDLEAFAGAGLYDSVPLVPLCHVAVDYGGERLVWDGAFRDKLLGSVAKLGREVEAAFGGQPQDIEGVYSGDKYYVVQSRPQIIRKQ
ncbi:hypothetical protein N2152v2_008317 [Parachlorella kessleri]